MFVIVNEESMFDGPVVADWGLDGQLPPDKETAKEYRDELREKYGNEGINAYRLVPLDGTMSKAELLDELTDAVVKMKCDEKYDMGPERQRGFVSGFIYALLWAGIASNEETDAAYMRGVAEFEKTYGDKE